jgi:glucose-1-phosphate adenylyltransferase
MNNVVALVDLHNTTDLGLLSKNRPIASTTFMGRYAFIDFALSNLTNSGIDEIGILVQDHSRSIIKHFGGKNTYLRNPKTGFQNIFINEEGLLNPQFNTDIHNIKENDWILYDNNVKYIIICPVHYLMHIDYNEIMEEHIKSNRQISAVVADVTNADDPSLYHAETCVVDPIGDIQKFDINDGSNKKASICLQTYIFNADYLRDALKKVDNISQIFNINDLVHYLCTYIEKVNAINFKGSFRRLSSLNDYYNVSMESLNHNENYVANLFPKDWPIYTLTHNTRPVLYGEKSDVSESLIANGCTIDGTVKHSVLSRNVIVEEGATVEDSIIFTNTIVRKGVHIKNAVVDKHCVFETKKNVGGTPTDPLYIPQGAII